MSGEFSATSKASSEKEKQTFLRSKNVYGELDAMNVVNDEPKVHSLGMVKRCEA